jgi:toxin ParE1/3/4
MTVVFTYRAEADLEAIGDWIAQDNPSRAISFVQDIRRACLSLADTPRISPLVSGFEDRGIRRRTYRGYLIFHRLVGDVIEIMRIIHGARDYEAILSQSAE